MRAVLRDFPARKMFQAPPRDAIPHDLGAEHQMWRPISLVHLFHTGQFYQIPYAEFNSDFAHSAVFMVKYGK